MKRRSIYHMDKEQNLWFKKRFDILVCESQFVAIDFNCVVELVVCTVRVKYKSVDIFESSLFYWISSKLEQTNEMKETTDLKAILVWNVSNFSFKTSKLVSTYT